MKDVDPQIIERCKSGDASALAEIYRTYSERVFRTCLKMMGNQHDAEDLTQDVFIRIYENVSSFEARSGFGTWVYRLTVRLCLNALDERKRRNFALSESGSQSAPKQFISGGSHPVSSPEEELIRREEMAALAKALNGLKPKHKVCIVLKDIEGLSYEEISEALGIPMGTVMSRLSRGRRLLSRKLEQFMGE